MILPLIALGIGVLGAGFVVLAESDNEKSKEIANNAKAPMPTISNQAILAQQAYALSAARQRHAMSQGIQNAYASSQYYSLGGLANAYASQGYGAQRSTKPTPDAVYNKYLLTSDLLEQFLSETKTHAGKISLEVFAAWLVIQSSKADGEAPPKEALEIMARIHQ